MNGKKNKKNAKIILAIILLLGSLLRIYGLGDESFWLDESYTVKSVEYRIQDLIKMDYVNSTILPQYFGKGAGSVPFYYIMVNYWTKAFGLSEFKLRLASALFGILAIYLMFLVGRFLFSDGIGLTAAFILAINHQHIFFSQEARMYSMLVSLTLLSVLFLLHALSTNNTLCWAGFVLANVALLYTHYFSFFILLFEALYVLLYPSKFKKVVKKAILSAIAIFILYLPWIPALARQVSYGPPIGRFLGGVTAYEFITTAISFNSWISPDINTRLALRAMNFAELSFSAWMLLLSVIMIAFLLGLAFLSGITCIRGGKPNAGFFKDHKIIFLLLWFLIPVFVPLLISLLSPNNAIFSNIRYVLAASPAYYLIASLGISRMPQWKPLFLILLVIFSISPLYSYYANFDKQQLREAAAYIADKRSSNEYVFIHKSNVILPFSYYHPDMTNVVNIEDINELKMHLKGKSSFWLLLSMEKFSDPQGTIKQYLNSRYIVMEKMEFVDVNIFHYQEIKNGSAATNTN